LIGVLYAMTLCNYGEFHLQKWGILLYNKHLGNLLVEMQDEHQLSKFMSKLKKVELLIIDELGYVELSRQTTRLMFQIFSERYERGSILVTTNLEFAEWTSIFHDERMTAAILDRLIHNSKILLFS
jgi:DNA replication protein DnaC